MWVDYSEALNIFVCTTARKTILIKTTVTKPLATVQDSCFLDFFPLKLYTIQFMYIQNNA